MLKFYYSKGSSALAAHILLIELGAAHEAIEVSIPKGEHRAPAFLKRNPKGRIPVLETPDGVISENPAILEYIAAFAGGGCVPQGAFEQAQARSLAAYLCATAHVAFAHRHRGHRWAELDSSIRDMQGRVPQNLAKCAEIIEAEQRFAPWVRGADYTFCDPYLFQFSRWLEGAGVALQDFPKLAAHTEAMRARPATQSALSLHGLS